MRPAAVVTGVAATMVLATGVATAVSRAHHDRPAALPAVCRDTAGTTGGALPDGRLLDLAVGNTLRDGNLGPPKAIARQGGSAAFGAGTQAEIDARAKALTGGGGGGAGGPSTAPDRPDPSRAPQGDQAGGGGGAGGPGGAGTGSGSGASTGGGGGIGTQPQTGAGAGRQPGAPLPATQPQQHQQPTEPKSAQRAHSLAGWWLVVVIALAIAALFAAVLRSRRPRTGDAFTEHLDLDASEAAARAAEARRRNDLDAALRWTFVAGLLRLDDAGVMPFDPARTTRAIGRRLRSRLFNDLAAVFDHVAYGGRPATEGDVDEAIRGWDLLLIEHRPA
ncbi:MAG TPA: DUF4129 domain-containing protein [Mycobacteriales bacterium]|nr:DUF4129 domain-containing protein [Mycobacteriales bacterium]